MGLFGTDGVRGAFGQAPIDQPTITALGSRLGATLRKRSAEPVVIVAGDTRESTPVIFDWLRDALERSGVSVRWAGVLPTPAVALLTRAVAADAGIAISASHNPFCDNGLKLFDREGFKWSSEAEAALEAELTSAEPPAGARSAHETPSLREPEAQLREVYVDRICSALEEAAAREECGGKGNGDGGGNEPPLVGLTVALDCANGAASPIAAEVFERLGAQAHSFHDRPDGRNINEACGSTHPSEIVRLVQETGSDMGFAFDGDADRLIATDNQGQVLDGDVLLYLWSSRLHESGQLSPPRIVATQMSNLGLEESLATRNISVVRCDVGDRAVVSQMRSDSLVLGGEQSGHLVNLALSTTGDGLQSALHIARLAGRGGLSRWLEGFVRYPQVLINVRVAQKPDFDSLPGVAKIANRIQEQLGASGRLLLRYSGTEPLARVMIEGRDHDEIERLANELAERIGAEIGAR